MMRRTVLTVCCVGAAVLGTSCGGNKSLAKRRAAGFYEALVGGRIGTAAQYVLDEDYPAFFESWRPAREKLEGVRGYQVSVKLDETGTGGLAICTVKTGAGDVTLTYALRRAGQDWWIRVHKP